MTNEDLLKIAKTSPALTWKSDKKGAFAYPPNFRGRVPLMVKVLSDSQSDIPTKDISVQKDKRYYVWVNSYGAVSAILPNGEQLGLKPSEFEVIEWHQPKDHMLLQCKTCGKSYYLYQYYNGESKEGCPMSKDACICGSSDITISEK